MKKLEYRREIAAALKRELGGSHQAVNACMNWTNASERTAKNWLTGGHGPAGYHLIELMRHSDEVAETVLTLCGRGEVCISIEVKGQRSKSRKQAGHMTASDKCTYQIKKGLLCRSHPHRAFAAPFTKR